LCPCGDRSRRRGDRGGARRVQPCDPAGRADARAGARSGGGRSMNVTEAALAMPPKRPRRHGGAAAKPQVGKPQQEGGATMSSRELDDLLLHIRGLVVVREILRQRGASAAELDQHTAELERLKSRLAELAVPATLPGR